MADERKSYRAVILTALPVEYQAVRRHLTSPREHVHERGTVYEIGVFRGAKADWEVCLVEIGAGNAGASFEVERAIATYRPVVALFVGVAGGLKDVAIGDIVFSTKIYGFESGKAASSFKPRPDVGESTYALQQRARAEARKLDWLGRLDSLSPNLSPKVFVAPIAAGEKVVASKRSAAAIFLKKTYSDAIAVEMEGRGFLKACHANRQIEAGVIRGISDLLADKQHVEAQGSQPLAAAHAAAFAFQVLDQFDVVLELDKSSDLPKSAIRYVVLISGNFKEEDLTFAKAAFEFLKHKANDPSMVLEKVAGGSIALHIRGSVEGFQRLNTLISVDEIRSFGGRQFLGAKLQAPDKPGQRKKSAKETASSRRLRYKIAELSQGNQREFYTRLFSLATRLTAAHALRGLDLDPADLVQETIFRYLSDNQVPDINTPLVTYLVAIMRRVINGRMARPENKTRAAFSEVDFVADQSSPPDEILSAEQMVSLFRSALADGSAERRIFEFIAETGETSNGDIARALGISTREVEKSRKRLRVKLSSLANDPSFAAELSAVGAKG